MKYLASSATRRYALTVLGLVLLSGCKQSRNNPGAHVGGVTGSAGIGALRSAAVSMFLVAPDGSSVQPAVETGVRTDANGNFQFAAQPTATFRVVAKGGTYVDPTTATTITNTVELSAVVPGGTPSVQLSMVTTFADEIAQGRLRRRSNPSQDDVTAEVADANAVVDTSFGITNHAYQVTPMMTPPNAAADPTGDRYRMGALAGAYSQLALDYAQRCQAPEQEVLTALIQDSLDRVFDGRTLDPQDPQQVVPLQALCGGTNENLPVGTGTVDLLAALETFATTAQGQIMQLAANTAMTQAIRTGLASGVLAPPAVLVVPSQGLIAIDTSANIAYVPIYSQDANGNAQVAVVDLDPAVTTPVLAVLALPGSVQPIASSLDPLTGRVYIAARRANNVVNVYVVETATRQILQTIETTGITHSGQKGGILVNPLKGKVVVVGTGTAGIIDISVDPATYSSTSVVSLGGTDSISLNLETEVMFVADDGANRVLDTSVSPPTSKNFRSNLGVTDGNAFDNLTNTVILDPEFEDRTHVINMAELDLVPATATAPLRTVQGLGATSLDGEGPGGQAVVNILRHQGIVADEFGQNFRLIQLPTHAYAGAANNKGQPGSGTVADASSAYSIAAAVLPNLDVNGTGTAVPVGMRGDPNSLTVDPVRNMLYALVDDHLSFNAWPAGSNRPLYLARVDLSNPVFGASPTAATHWLPATTYIRMP